MSRFVVANGMTAEVRRAFENRPRLVDGAPGFERLEVLVARDNPDEFWLLTWWRDEPSFRSWHRSHQYGEAHRGIPKGLRLVPRETVVRVLDRVCQ